MVSSVRTSADTMLAVVPSRAPVSESSMKVPTSAFFNVSPSSRFEDDEAWVRYVSEGLTQLHYWVTKMLEAADDNHRDCNVTHYILFKHIDHLISHALCPSELAELRQRFSTRAISAENAWKGLIDLCAQLSTLWKGLAKLEEAGVACAKDSEARIELVEYCKQLSKTAAILVSDWDSSLAGAQILTPDATPTFQSRIDAKTMVLMIMLTVCNIAAVAVTWIGMSGQLAGVVTALMLGAHAVAIVIVVSYRNAQQRADELLSWTSVPFASRRDSSSVEPEPDGQQVRVHSLFSSGNNTSQYDVSRVSATRPMDHSSGSPSITRRVAAASGTSQYSVSRQQSAHQTLDVNVIAREFLVIGFDEHHRITFWSEHAAIVTHFAAQEVMGKAMTSILGTKSSKEFKKLFDPAVVMPPKGQQVDQDTASVVRRWRIVLNTRATQITATVNGRRSSRGGGVMYGQVHDLEELQALSHLCEIQAHLIEENKYFPDAVSCIGGTIKNLRASAERAVSSWEERDNTVLRYDIKVAAPMAEVVVSETIPRLYLDIVSVRRLVRWLVDEVKNQCNVVVRVEQDEGNLISPWLRFVVGATNGTKLPPTARAASIDYITGKGYCFSVLHSEDENIHISIPASRSSFGELGVSRANELSPTLSPTSRKNQTKRSDGAEYSGHIVIYEPAIVNLCQILAAWHDAAPNVTFSAQDSADQALAYCRDAMAHVDAVIVPRTEVEKNPESWKTLSNIMILQSEENMSNFPLPNIRWLPLPVNPQCVMETMISIQSFQVSRQLRQLQEKYDFKECLGKGATSEVYLAVGSVTKSKVAIKQYTRKEYQGKATYECTVLEHINCQEGHRNIIKLITMLNDSTAAPAIVLEYCQESVEKVLLHTESMPLKLIQDYAIQCLEAARFLHFRGVVHRDIKTANLLLKDGVLRLSDFGSAIILKDVSSQLTGECTPSYRSPEIIRPSEFPAMNPPDLSRRLMASDIWACGIVALALLKNVPEALLHPVRQTKFLASPIDMEAFITTNTNFRFDGSKGALPKEWQRFLLSVLEHDWRKRPTAQLLLQKNILHQPIEQVAISLPNFSNDDSSDSPPQQQATILSVLS